MLTVAYVEATLDRNNVYRWYKMFSEGWEDVNDEERAGHPTTLTTDENIDEVKKIVLLNRRITVKEFADLTYRLTRAILFLPMIWAWQNNTLVMPQLPYSPDLDPWLFLVSETEEAHERTTLRYDWGDKDGIEGGAEQDHKNWFLEVLRGLEKRWHKCIISGEDSFEEDKIDIHEEINNFWKTQNSRNFLNTPRILNSIYSLLLMSCSTIIINTWMLFGIK